jgi:hypothetical protein
VIGAQATAAGEPEGKYLRRPTVATIHWMAEVLIIGTHCAPGAQRKTVVGLGNAFARIGEMPIADEPLRDW